MSLPKTTKQYVLKDTKGFNSLEVQNDVPLPELGPFDCLVQMEAVSLNYRDLIIAKNQYPLMLKDGPLIPASDGAGVVESVGEDVTDWKSGDRVAGIFTVSFAIT